MKNAPAPFHVRCQVDARHTGQQAAIGELGEEPHQANPARRPLEPLRLAQELGHRALAVEELEQRGVAIRHPEEAVRLEVAEHPALIALGSRESLQGVSGARLRPAAEPTAPHRPGFDDDGPPGLVVGPPALDEQLLVPHAEPGAIPQLLAAVEAAAVEPCPVARARVLDRGGPVLGRHHDARLAVRHRRVVEPNGVFRRPPDRDVLRKRHAPPVGQD
jgi:hypothetical protein